MTDDFHAAIAAEILAAADARQELLTSVVRVARGIFRARASSIALLDPTTAELVFEAVSGEGEAGLTGSRFPARAGIAGAVLQSEESLVLDDVRQDPRFARQVAEGSGYVPRALMAAPLIRNNEAFGVLTVLDRGETGRGSLEEVETLVAFADQAAIAVELTTAAARARALLDAAPADLHAVARVAAAGSAGVRVLEAVADLLGERA